MFTNPQKQPFLGWDDFMPLKPHEWLKETRLDRGLKQVDVERLTAESGEHTRVSQSHLSKIERGHTPLQQLGPIKLEALRQVLGVSHDQWLRGTGLAVVSTSHRPPALFQESAPTVLIPPNLEQALSILAAEDPAYAERRFAEKLAMIDPEDGDADPPVSEWMELAKAFMRIRKKRRG